MSDAPSFDLARCKVGDCDWSTLTSTGAYDKLREHLQEEHGYTDEDWQETRSELVRGGRDV
jgi:hypothetical protein